MIMTYYRQPTISYSCLMVNIPGSSVSRRYRDIGNVNLSRSRLFQPLLVVTGPRCPVGSTSSMVLPIAVL